MYSYGASCECRLINGFFFSSRRRHTRWPRDWSSDVCSSDLLVGEVTAVSGQTCTVLLATDARSVVGVRLAPSGQIGWVTGPGKTRTGSGPLKLQVLDSAAVLKPGEQLVTAAS